MEPGVDLGVAGEDGDAGEGEDEGLNALPPSDSRFKCRPPPALGVDGGGSAEDEEKDDMAAGEAAMLLYERELGEMRRPCSRPTAEGL